MNSSERLLTALAVGACLWGNGCGEQRGTATLSEQEAVILARKAAEDAGRWSPNPTAIKHAAGSWAITFSSFDGTGALATVRIADADRMVRTFITMDSGRR